MKSKIERWQNYCVYKTFQTVLDRKTCILLLKLYFLLALYSSIVVGAQRDTDIVGSWNSSQGRMQEF